MSIELSSPRRFGKATLWRDWMAKRGQIPDEAPPPQCVTCRQPMFRAGYTLEVEGGYWEPVYVRLCGCGLPETHWFREMFDNRKSPLWGWKYVED